MKLIVNTIVVGIVLTCGVRFAEATWVQNPVNATITSVRVYEVGAGGVRLQMTISGTTHNCGTGPTTIYYDSDKISLAAQKAITSVALAAMLADRPVRVTYDCSLAGGGYGWGVAISASN